MSPDLECDVCGHGWEKHRKPPDGCGEVLSDGNWHYLCGCTEKAPSVLESMK